MQDLPEGFPREGRLKRPLTCPAVQILKVSGFEVIHLHKPAHVNLQVWLVFLRLPVVKIFLAALCLSGRADLCFFEVASRHPALRKQPVRLPINRQSRMADLALFGAFCGPRVGGNVFVQGKVGNIIIARVVVGNDLAPSSEHRGARCQYVHVFNHVAHLFALTHSHFSPPGFVMEMHWLSVSLLLLIF